MKSSILVPNIQTRSRQRGATLIEVLVAVIIMSIGLLGVAAMQSIALRNTQGSMERTQAVIQSYAMLDAMRANLTAARSGAYAMGETCAPPAAGSLVQSDKNMWIASLQAAVGPTACGAIECGADDVCSIIVTWDDTRASDGEEKYAITTTSRL